MTAPLTPARLAEVDDLRAWPGVMIDAGQDASAEVVLEAVSDYVRAESGDVNRWPDPATASAAVRRLVVQIAARVWRNPGNASMITTGPFTDQYASAGLVGMSLTEAERTVLNAAISRRKLRTISTTRDEQCVGDGYIDRFSGSFVPWSDAPPPGALYGPTL